MSERLTRRFALGLSLLCLSPLARAEDKSLLKPAAIEATAIQLAPMSADEMKAAGERAWPALSGSLSRSGRRSG